MNLRVWHIPQVPMDNPFHVEVPDVATAMLVIRSLWAYDTYQFDNNIKPDYSNASGLEYFDIVDEEWQEWSDDDGEQIVDLLDAQDDAESNDDHDDDDQEEDGDE